MADPFQELAAMRRLMEELTAEPQRAGAPWLPPLDVRETTDQFVLSLDLPGVRQDAIQVDLDEGTLVVSGVRERPDDERGDRFHRAERRFGAFARSVQLPRGVDESEIVADYRDGVLEIRIRKPEARRARRIEITSSD